MWRTTATEKKLFNILSHVGDTFIAFDTETTGLKAETDRIIQISAIKYLIEDNYRLHKLCELNEYINPCFYLNPKITEITGITDSLLETKPIEEEIFPVIHDFFGDAPNLAAYNAKFDISFLSALYERNGAKLSGVIYNSKGKVNDLETAVDVLQMARDLVDKKDTENFKLATICELYGLSDGIEWHNASGDVDATGQLMQVLIQEYQDRAAGKEFKDSDTTKKTAVILSARYWEGFRGFSRIYVNTDIGVLFYDMRNKKWGEKDKGLLDIVDMEKLRTDLFKKYNVVSDDDFADYIRRKDKEEKEAS